MYQSPAVLVLIVPVLVVQVVRVALVLNPKAGLTTVQQIGKNKNTMAD
jgi:hypothetical protein